MNLLEKIDKPEKSNPKMPRHHRDKTVKSEHLDDALDEGLKNLPRF